MWTNKRIENVKELLSDIGEKDMLEIMTCKASRVIKTKI